MKGTAFAAYIRQKTKTNSNTLTDADIVTFANRVQEELAADIAANVTENYFDMELFRDLEAGIRGYTYATDILNNQKYIAAKLDGSNWTYLNEAYFSEFTLPMREESYIISKYAAKKPEFYISGREVFILNGDAILAVSGGLKMVAEVYPEDLTTGDLSSTDDLSIPSTDTATRLPRQVHPHWATKIIIEWKESRDKPIALTQTEQRVEQDLMKTYERLRNRNQVRSFQSTVPQDDGQDY